MCDDIKFIAHRANYDGDTNNENKILKINKCFQCGYDVEIDVWYDKNKGFLLGHDAGIDEIEIEYMNYWSNKLWIHCKNLDCFEQLINNKKLNIFYHTNEDIVLTSKGYVWTYPGIYQMKNSILVLPENNICNLNKLSNIVGVCSDNIKYYKTKLGG